MLLRLRMLEASNDAQNHRSLQTPTDAAARTTRAPLHGSREALTRERSMLLCAQPAAERWSRGCGTGVGLSGGIVPYGPGVLEANWWVL